MYKITLLIVFLTCWTMQGQSQLNQNQVDSMTYQYFIDGDWQKLIETGKLANREHINFKYLQQRMGYAYFMQGKFYASIYHYENALAFDSADEITHLYLYLNHSYLGNYSKAAYYGGYLPKATQDLYDISIFKPISALDYEFNIKIPDNELRDNATFHRLGLSSQISSQLFLYQSLSTYGQITDYTKNIRQNEYYGILTYTPISSLSFQLAYHGLGTNIIADPDTFKYKGNLLLGKVTYNKGRVDLGVSYSYLNLNYATSKQTGLHGGIGFSGKVSAYFKSTLYYLTETGTAINGGDYTYDRFVFQQTAGFMPLKKIWLEGFIAMGDLNNFADFNGMYVYNTADPTTSKWGATLYVYPLDKLIFFVNFAMEQKNILLYDLQYQQNSFSGGIIWKL